MNILKILFLFCFTPCIALAGNLNMGSNENCVNRRDPFEGMSNIQRHLCENALKSNNSEAVQAACVNDVNTGWNSTRDNSMSPANGNVGKSMAVILMGNKITQGIQVCPGVYLATAHGALNNNPNVDPKSLNIRAVAYPFVPENLMTSTGNNSKFISPRLSNHPNYDSSKSDSIETDYVFIKVDKPVRPQNFVAPVSDRENILVSASNRGQVDVHLYRGRTRYRTQEDRTTPVTKEVTTSRGTHVEVDQDGWATDLGYMMKNIYTEPLKVNTRCVLSPSGDHGINSDCPTEQSVSGSSYVTRINGKDMLVGLHNWGSNVYSSNKELPTGGFTPSTQFCSDYESACGKPCKDLSDTGYQSVSL